jgi:beta-mannanase
VRIFRRERATNVRFVWGPNEETGGVRLIRRLYPGDRWVDWLGFSSFCWGGSWGWRSPSAVYEHMYRTLAGIADKPIVVAETGAGEVGGEKARWIRRAFDRDLPRLRRIRAVVWFDEHDRMADFRVDSTRAALRAFRTAVASPRYSGTPADVKQGGLGR